MTATPRIDASRRRSVSGTAEKAQSWISLASIAAATVARSGNTR
jgi:hypothetical protein